MTGRLEAPSFSLEQTLECGQFFRFTRTGEDYLVQTSGRIFKVRQKGCALFVSGADEAFIRRFFRLDDDLPAILRAIDRDPVIGRAIAASPGLRMIRQDPWECLVSYLCSSAKAIPQIRSIVEALCRCSGNRLSFENFVGYDFPDPLCLSRHRGLDSLGAGFRAAYLAEAGRGIGRPELEGLRTASYVEARDRLMGLAGVGRKVADCVLLYSLDFLEAFPIDTWIRKGLESAYFEGGKTSERQLEAFVASRFGPLAGYAQLYLYAYWRRHPEELERKAGHAGAVGRKRPPPEEDGRRGRASLRWGIPGVLGGALQIFFGL
jgi:N-glycosylase/DNA lyase